MFVTFLVFVGDVLGSLERMDEKVGDLFVCRYFCLLVFLLPFALYLLIVCHWFDRTDDYRFVCLASISVCQFYSYVSLFISILYRLFVLGKLERMDEKAGGPWEVNGD